MDWSTLRLEIKAATDDFLKEKQRRIDEEKRRIESLANTADAIVNDIPKLIRKCIERQENSIVLFEGTDLEGEDAASTISSKIRTRLEEQGIKSSLDIESTNQEYDNTDSYTVEVSISELIKFAEKSPYLRV
jgi:sugar-specific transcriptional regulator TrmB